MRIALLHNGYQERGGEDATVDFEQELLKQRGHDVFRFEVSNAEIFDPPRARAVQALWRAPFNRGAKRRVQRFLRERRIEIGHVHNWFPLLSPSVYEAHRELGLPVVQTLHNYRLGCAAATFRRREQDCFDCLDRGRGEALRHACYRGSRLLTGAWKRTMDRGWERGHFQEGVSMYLAPCEFVAQAHRRAGLPAERLRVLPHGVPDPRQFANEDPRPRQRGAVFVGRLVEEKGIEVLLSAWKRLDVPLTIIGTGPLEDRVAAAALEHRWIDWIPELPRSQVLGEIARRDFLVMPHLWPETFCLVVVEALACGKAVIASRLGGPADTVQHGHTGLHVDPGDVRGLHRAVSELHRDRERCAAMGRAARASYEQLYHPDAHGDALLQVFSELLDVEARKAA